MRIWEILTLGVGLSMDASAVGMTNGMVEPKMKVGKVCLIAFFYALFQFIMPILGYYCASAFSSVVAKIAPWLSFALLAFIGGKMIFDSFKKEEKQTEPVKLGKLCVQAIATSIDALAVGVTLLARETTVGLPCNIWLCSLIIGATTFCFAITAVYIGKAVGDMLADKAELIGGVILVAIGLKILIESLI